MHVLNCFPPPLNAKKLDEYGDLAETISDPITRLHMHDLITMVTKFYETPPSALPSTPHPVGMGTITNLEEEEIERMYAFVPASNELTAITKMFDKLPLGEAREAAFHLLWFAFELMNDREPCTSDKL